jgi:hypothetical protein
MQDTAHAARTLTARQGDPLEDPLEQASPRSKVRASLGRAPSRSRGCASLERTPPRSRDRSPSSGLRLARGSAPPSTGVRLARGRPRSRAPAPVHWAFNALTPAGQCHHAPGARASVPPRQLPRREPIPITVGEGLCSAAGVSPVTPCACSSTANVPSPRRGVGFTLDLLSCDPTRLGEGARREERHPWHCYGMAAALARAGARLALWQRLQYGGAHWNGTPFYLLLYSVRANVSNTLEPIRRHHRHPLLSCPRTATVRVQNRP